MKDFVLTHLALPILTALLWVVVRQQIFALPRLRKELIDLNKRRANRVQTALAAPAPPAWTEPAIAPNHSFSGSVDLKGDGTLLVGGQILRPTEAFEVTARDSHHIPRAVVVARGNGDVLIRSHGQVFLARFEHQAWNVQVLSAAE